MIACFYKKTFLKDLSKLPWHSRHQVEKLVFEEIPKLDNIFATLDIKKMKGYRDYYRVRVGDYRIGCRVEEGNRVVLYRVKSRGNIYKVFPE